MIFGINSKYIEKLEADLGLERLQNQTLRRQLIEAQNDNDHEKWLAQASAELVEAEDEKKLWELYRDERRNLVLMVAGGFVPKEATNSKALEKATEALKVWKERPIK